MNKNMKLELFEASTQNWDDVVEMQAKLNDFLALNGANVVKTAEMIVGIFLVVFVYVAIE